MIKLFPIFYSPDGDAASGGGSVGETGSASFGGQSAALAPAQTAPASPSGVSTAPGAFDIRQHLDDAGSFKDGWHKAAGVSENLAKKFTRPEALARSYESLESKISAKGIIMPGPNATQQEKDAFYSALGRPAKPEDYAFQKPDKIGDRAVPAEAWDSRRAEAWQKELYEAGCTKEQAQRIMQASIKESLEGRAMMDQAMQQSQQQGKAALQKEWGLEYDNNIKAAQRAAEQFGGDELKNHPGLGNDPIMIKALAKIGLATQERPGVGTRQQAGSDRMSPADAKAEGQRLTQMINERTKSDRNWSNTPEAQQLKARKSDLYKLAYPEQ